MKEEKMRGEKLAETDKEKGPKENKPEIVCKYPELIEEGLCVKTNGICACLLV